MAVAGNHLSDLASAAPVATTSAMYVLGLPLEQWVVILNFVYIVGLILYKVVQSVNTWRDNRNGSK